MLPPMPYETPAPVKIGKGKAGPGRPKGLANRTTALLKDAILKAAERAGGKGGLEAFLVMQANKENNAPFMALLAKILPMQVTDGEGGAGIVVEIIRRSYADDPVLSDPYAARARADDVREELAAARAKLVEMTAVPLLPGPDLT